MTTRTDMERPNGSALRRVAAIAVAVVALFGFGGGIATAAHAGVGTSPTGPISR
jgi:hypothetical protein